MSTRTDYAGLLFLKPAFPQFRCGIKPPIAGENPRCSGRHAGTSNRGFCVMEQLTERECAIRAAAIIDTDGSIMISRNRRSHGTIFVVTCSVGSIDRRILYWLQENYYGTICKNDRQKGDNYQRRPFYLWCITAKKAEAFLKQIEPFLILKGKQAHCALQLRQFQNVFGGNPQERKEELFAPFEKQIKELNHASHPE